MGSSVSRCEDAISAFPPPASIPEMQSSDQKNGGLPCPTKFEEMQREIYMSLRPEMFEGLRLDFVKPVNEQFALTHGIVMGNTELPTQGPQVYKCPLATYEFGANVMTKKLLMVGRINSEGRLSGRIKYDLSDWFGLRWQSQFSKDPDITQQIVDLDLTGGDWNAQIKLGNSGFFGLNYMQSVTSKLALGSEVFYLDEQRKSGLGVAARLSDDKYISTIQASTAGLISMSYLQKVGEKTSLIADFLYNSNVGEATTTLGYDYVFTRAHVRGKIDSNGVLGAYIEERLNQGVTFLMSGEIDHSKKNYKFGFGLQLGE